MEIKFIYTDNDYIELNKFYNEERGISQRGRLTNAILFPGILLLVLIIIMQKIGKFQIIPFLTWVILTLLWVIFNKAICNYKLNRRFKYILKDENLKGIDFYKDTKITLDNEGIVKEIEGIETIARWDAVEKVNVTKKNIFIRLINDTYINIPIRALKNSNKDKFYKIINDNCNVIINN